MKRFILLIGLVICAYGMLIKGQLGLHVTPEHTVLFGQDTTTNGLKVMWQPSKGSLRAGVMTSAWNYNNLGNVSVAFGSDTQASGNYSLATGIGTQANSYAEMSIGRYALFGGSKTVWDETGADVVFEIGNGLGPSVRSNMFTVQKSGNVKIGAMTDATETINEKLVVDGGIVISDAIDATPVVGTVQYNTSSQQFQGYNGSQWINMTSNLSNGIPLTCEETGIDDSSTSFPESYFDCKIGGGWERVGIDPEDFNEIPLGKQFHVMHISVVPTQVWAGRYEVQGSLGLNNSFIPYQYHARISVQRSTEASSDADLLYEIRGLVEESQHISSPTPLMVLNPGDRIFAQNLNGNSFSNDVRISVTGMLYDIN